MPVLRDDRVPDSVSPERQLGVEEELLLIDPRSRRAVPAIGAVLRVDRADGAGGRPVEHELLQHQVEVQSRPVTDGPALRAELVAARRAAGEAAARLGLALAASGVAPAGVDVAVTDDERYRAMVEQFGDVARRGGTCGMHVHVDVASPDEAVRVIDRLGPLLSSVLALSANSPIDDGHDTGYASWRSRQWAQWPTAGPTAPFGSFESYREVTATLVSTGAARDPGMLYFDARWAPRFRTVEVRVCDVLTDVDDAVAVALLVRALVDTAADPGYDPPPAPRLELVRAGRWLAARDGVGGRLLGLDHRHPLPSREAVEELLDVSLSSLDGAGDTDLVRAGVERLLAGSGAARQRAALERTGSPTGVVDDLVARTARSWE